MGSATVETRNAMGFKALDNLEAFLLRRRDATGPGEGFLALALGFLASRRLAGLGRWPGERRSAQPAWFDGDRRAATGAAAAARSVPAGAASGGGAVL